MPELISLDTETHLITPGNLAPKPVCASFDDGSHAWMERFLNPHDDECAEETLEGLFRPGVTIAMANGSYDWAVIARRVPSFLSQIFVLYTRGQIWDVEIVAALDAIAEGRMTDGMVLNRLFQPLRKFGSEGPVTNRFSLSNCVWLYTGRLDAKVNDKFRTAYGELDKLPTSQWPEKARQYPLDDAANTREVAAIQMGKVPGIAAARNIGPVGCLPGVTWPVFQCRAAFAMHLGSVWGFRTNKERIDAIEAKVNKTLEADTAKFLDWGFLKPDGKENRPTIKREVAIAYGSNPKSPCTACQGTGKVLSEKTRKPVNCKVCDSTGIYISGTVPRTPADGIATDRDTLAGTGNERLEAWAEASKNDKARDVYLPWVNQGINHPINVRSNPLVASGRCSYDGLVQLIPPLMRECIEAREDMVFCSTDYPSLELCTLAQTTYTVKGYSRMRDVINETGDPGALHTEFGAKMAGIDVGNAAAMAAFKKAAEDKSSAEYKFRFMAKAGNFGFPGGMGPVKLAQAKRKEGLFFCVASGLNKVCKPGVFEWKGKPLDKPTCPDCIQVATRLRDDWFAAWPEIKPYFEWVTTIPGIEDGKGVLETPLTGFVRGGLSFTSAANHSFQHLGACAAKHALWNVTEEAYTDPKSPLWGTRPLILVHDEIFSEMPRKGMLAAGFRTAEIMRDALKVFCPDIRVPLPEPAFMKFWSKKATLLRDAQGNPLDQVWEPTDKEGKPVAWAP